VGFLFSYIRKRRDDGPGPSHTRYAFAGNLKQTSLLDAVQFLELGRREGVLHIYSGRRKGYLSFCGGRVIDAFYRDRTGKDAIFGMLECEEGDFYFEPSLLRIRRFWPSRSSTSPLNGTAAKALRDENVRGTFQPGRIQP